MITVPVLKELGFSMLPSTLSNYKGRLTVRLSFYIRTTELRAAVRSSSQALVLPPRQRASLAFIEMTGLGLVYCCVPPGIGKL